MERRKNAVVSDCQDEYGLVKKNYLGTILFMVTGFQSDYVIYADIF